MESRVEERDYLGRSQEQSCLVLIQLMPLTGLNLRSNPAQDVRAVTVLCTSWSPQKMSLCQVWHFGCRQSETPPRFGVVLLCSSPPGNTSELLWEWSLEPRAEFDSASVSSGACPDDKSWVLSTDPTSGTRSMNFFS